MSNPHHHLHTKLQPPAVPAENQFPPNTEAPAGNSRAWPAAGHRANPTAGQKEPVRCRYSGSLWHKNLPPASRFQAGRARPGTGGQEREESHARSLGPGRARGPGKGSGPAAGPAPAGASRPAPRSDCHRASPHRRHRGTSGAAWRGRRRLRAAATGRCRPSRTGPGEATLTGRRGVGAGPWPAAARGAAPGAGEGGKGTGAGGSQAARASPVPAGPARLRPRRSRLCRVQLPPGPPRWPARPDQSALGTAGATDQSAERTRPRPAPPAARPRPPTLPPGLSRDTRGGGAQRPTTNEKSQRVPPQPIGGRTVPSLREAGQAGGGRGGVAPVTGTLPQRALGARWASVPGSAQGNSLWASVERGRFQCLGRDRMARGRCLRARPRRRRKPPERSRGREAFPVPSPRSASGSCSFCLPGCASPGAGRPLPLASSLRFPILGVTSALHILGLPCGTAPASVVRGQSQAFSQPRFYIPGSCGLHHRIVETGRDVWRSPSPTPPAEAGSPRAGDGNAPGGFGMSPERETPRPPWAAVPVVPAASMRCNFPRKCLSAASGNDELNPAPVRSGGFESVHKGMLVLDRRQPSLAWCQL